MADNQSATSGVVQSGQEKPQDKKLDYETYKKEREFLSEFENQNYQNYEKTILTLSSAFLAFSVSFLGLLKNGDPSKTLSASSQYGVISHSTLIWSWVLFGFSVISTLLCFVISAIATRREVAKLELALKDAGALSSVNRWTQLVFVLYFLSGLSFIAGLILLITFAGQNALLL